MTYGREDSGYSRRGILLSRRIESRIGLALGDCGSTIFDFFDI